MPTTAPSQATATANTTNKKKVINNPHRVQVLVDFPDPTVTIKPVDPIAIPGPKRKFIAVADGDKSFYELKHVINDELHRLYVEEAPYGLCGFKNWQYCKIPERYLIRDVLGKQCDIHVTRELLSAKKLGKTIKRKTEETSSSPSSTATTATSDAAGSSAPAPKARKTKKEAVAPETDRKASIKEEAIAAPAIGASKETAKDKALQVAYASLTEEQIMMNISAAHTQEKKVASGIATPEASEPSASPAPAPAIPKKHKSAKKAVDAIETPAPTPAPTKVTETKVKKAATNIPFPQDSKEKSEEDIMKEISAYHQAQKLIGKTEETVRKIEETKNMKGTEKNVPAAAAFEVKKEQTKAKKELAKAAKVATKDAEVNGKETKSKLKKAAVTSPAKESSEPAGSSAAAKGKKVVEKGKKVVEKGYQSEDSSNSVPVIKEQKKSGARRKEENVEELEKWEAQDPATLTDEQIRELQLWHKRKHNRKSIELKRSAQLASKSVDPEVAAAATLFLQETTRRGRPSAASESLRTKFEKFIERTGSNTTSDGDADGDSDDEGSSSSSPEAETHVKEEPQQQRIKVEPKPTTRKELSSSDSESDSNSV